MRVLFYNRDISKIGISKQIDRMLKTHVGMCTEDFSACLDMKIGIRSCDQG